MSLHVVGREAWHTALIWRGHSLSLYICSMSIIASVGMGTNFLFFGGGGGGGRMNPKLIRPLVLYVVLQDTVKSLCWRVKYWRGGSTCPPPVPTPMATMWHCL